MAETKKKVLLITPAWKIENKSNLWRKIASCYPALGLAYIAAVLEEEGHEVLFIDMHAQNWSVKETVLHIKNSPEYEGLDFVGITATTPLITCALKLAKYIKKIDSKTKVILGGVHPTVLPEEVLSDDNVDFVVREEGEMTFKELVAGKDPSDVLGISFRKGNKIVHNPPRPQIEDLDTLPIPAYHLMPIDKYRPAVGSYKRLPAMSIFATRGCPGRCTFCHRAFKGKIRTRSARKIVEEIKVLQMDYGIKEISFYDDTFTAMKDNVREFCRIVLDEGIDITWSCFTRVNYIDEDLFALMKKAGCHHVMFGVESGNQHILDRMNKMITLDQIRKGVRILKGLGLETRAAYILGAIGETPETMQQTLDFALELDTDYAQFNIMTAYPGTDVWNEAEKNGWLRVKNYDYSVSDFTMELPTISNEEIFKMYKRAHRKYYLRPRMFWRRLKKMSSWSGIRETALVGIAILLGAD
ncbi:B12-binding domain-containing radical SAM protein [Candidatus Woesearchaeota archaeon]|nr:B12-binding domain-containing radical SAM protein [Candidatus Woesearchaeota archaeon]